MGPTYRKILWRLIPFLFVCNLFNYLDRVNVGFAKLQMLRDLGMSQTVYGLGAGIFFIGYLACGVPSNLILQRIGARRWVAIMMVSWGLLSTCLLFVRTPAGFYTLRLLTGAAEAGFFPGILLYLTRWFPRDRHGRVTTVFMSAIPISGVLGAAVGLDPGLFLGRAGRAGRLAMDVPAAGPADRVAGQRSVVPAQRRRARSELAQPAGKKQALARVLADDEAGKPAGASTSLRAVLCNPAVWLLGTVYFCIQSGVYAINFWLPSIIQDSGVTDPVRIGLMSAIPYLAAAVFMVLMGRSADRRGERRWHLVIPLLMGAAGLCIAASVTDNLGLALFGMTLATMGAVSGLPLFWPLTNGFLTAAAAAGGLALINSTGQVAGFVSPYLVGWIKDTTHSTQLALYVLAGAMLLGAALVLRVPACAVNQ